MDTAEKLLDGLDRVVCMFDIPCWRPLHAICDGYVLDQCMFQARGNKPTLMFSYRVDLGQLVRSCEHPGQNFV